MTRKCVKIYYPAGLISLIFLPILCIWNQQKAFIKYGALDIAYVYQAYSSRVEIDNFREYQIITFSGDHQKDLIAIEKAHHRLKSIVKNGDTLNGLHFKFDNSAKYWNLVKVNEFCQLEKAYIYIDGDDIWAYYTPPIKSTPSQPMFVCGTGEISSNMELSTEKSAAETMYLEKIAKEIYGPMLLFLTMCFFTFKRIKQLKN